MGRKTYLLSVWIEYQVGLCFSKSGKSQAITGLFLYEQNLVHCHVLKWVILHIEATKQSKRLKQSEKAFIPAKLKRFKSNLGTFTPST